MTQIDWDKAPEDAEFAGTLKGTQAPVFYKNVTDFDHEYSYGGSWSKCRNAPACLPLIPRHATWTGEGLPPVGTVCELKSASKFTEGTRLDEFPAGTRMLVGGRANFGGHDVAVVCVEGRHFCGTIIPEMLRPIRTQEQIAAEERKSAIDELVCGHDHEVLRSWATYVYDTLGYRKMMSDAEGVKS